MQILVSFCQRILHIVRGIHRTLNFGFSVLSNRFCILFAFSPVDEPKNRRWLKRKALHQSSVTNLKKVKNTIPTANENELGIVKIEHDDCSPLEDTTQESVDSASTSHGNSFLGFGEEIVRHPVLQGYTPNKKEAPLLVSKSNSCMYFGLSVKRFARFFFFFFFFFDVSKLYLVTQEVPLLTTIYHMLGRHSVYIYCVPAGGELVRGDLPVEYSYNQAEFIAAMNRDVAGVINPEPADDLNTTVNKTKEPTSEFSMVIPIVSLTRRSVTKTIRL